MRSLILIAILAGVARADPPAAATRGLMVAIGDGRVPLASLIDPARGVWVVDGASQQLACGVDLVDVMVEAQVHAAWWARTAMCENRGAVAACTLDSTQQRWQLRFERGGGSLVLRAFVRGDAKVADLPHGAPCPPGSKVPAPPPPVVATERRDAPAAGTTPTVATQAMLYHLAAGDWHLADFADRERGLVILDHPPDASGEGAVPTRDARVCGTALPAELAAIQQRITWPIHEVAKANATIDCENSKTGATCTVAEIGEWGPVMHLYFRQTEHGLVLDGFTVDDEHQVSAAEREPHYLATALALAHAWLSPCP